MSSEVSVILCHTLGPVEVTLDGGPAPAELLWRKNLALLIYLARSPRRTRSRDHLVGLLWGDRGETAARHSLSEALRVIRRGPARFDDEPVSSEDRLGKRGGGIGRTAYPLGRGRAADELMELALRDAVASPAIAADPSLAPTP